MYILTGIEKRTTRFFNCVLDQGPKKEKKGGKQWTEKKKKGRGR